MQSGRCAYCQRPIMLDSADPSNLATQDHFFPRGLGGPNSAGNIVAACQPCNHRKGMMPGPEFMRLFHESC
ncbi:HNH endonuclease [Sphingobium sp. AP50]|uniref:HNH endonuclease n=1 Tax=Sphingobium sp. AP50 TaxID=1884369 RepID=UPI000B8695EC|nr:HNH endonuclease [Sphingobium sp. AP50]